MNQEAIEEVERLLGELEGIVWQALSEGWYATYQSCAPRVEEIGSEIRALIRGREAGHPAE